jgi:hypothetical protein
MEVRCRFLGQPQDTIDARTCRAPQAIAAHGYYEPIRSRSSSPNSSPNGGQLTVLSMSLKACK